MTRRFKQIQAISFANAIIIIACVYVATILFYTFYKELQGYKAPPLFYIIFTLGLVVLFLALKLPGPYKINLAVALTSVAITLYSLELFLVVIDNYPIYTENTRVTDVNETGEYFDNRSPRDVAIDLEQQGITAYPFIAPYIFLQSMPRLDDKEIFALGSISNATTVYCNESGTYSIYESDEYGFQNPKNLWSVDQVDIAVVGGSFAHGACVPSDENAVALIRAVAVAVPSR